VRPRRFQFFELKSSDWICAIGSEILMTNLSIRNSRRSAHLRLLASIMILSLLQTGIGMSPRSSVQAAEPRSQATVQFETLNEIEGAERAYREAAQVEASARQNRDQAQAAQRQAREAMESARSQLSQKREALQQARARLQEQRNQIPNLRTQVDLLERELGDITRRARTAREAAQEKRSQAREAAAQARALLAAAEKAKQEGAPNASELMSQATEARRLAALSDQAADQAEAFADRAQAEQNRARSELDSKRELLARIQADIQELMQTRIPHLEREEQSIEQRFSVTQRELDSASRTYEGAQRNFDIAQSNREAAERRLAQVRYELEQAIAEARRRGSDAGARDGASEGAQRGNFTGRREGAEAGEREGRRDGMAEGMDRARRRGTQDGQESGWNLGVIQGSRDGQLNGNQEGRQRGEQEGLAAGYQDGYQSGDREGAVQGRSQGLKDGGFEKGADLGRTQGDARAREEGNRVGYPEGYKQKEEELRTGPLKEIAGFFQEVQAGSGLQAFFEKFTGALSKSRGTESVGASDAVNATARDLQSLSVIEASNARAFSHPAVRQAYEQAYRESYQLNYQRFYEREYRETYAQVRDITYRREFSEWANRDYPAEYREAYDRASSVAYAQSYQREYQVNYSRYYAPAYDAAYRSAFPVRRQEGYDRGFAEGYRRAREEAFDQEFARGYASTYETTYQAQLPSYLEAARVRGREAAGARYQSFPVSEVEALSLTDQSQDGIFAAGEPVQLRSVVSNFGFVPTAQQGDAALRIDLNVLTEGLELRTNAGFLKSIDARSRTTLDSTFVASDLRVKASARLGSVQRLQVRIYQGSQLLREQVLDLRVEQALSGLELTFEGPVSDEKWNSARILVKNQSQKATSALGFQLSSSVQQLEVQPATGTMGPLAPGEQRALSFQVRFPSSLAFQKLSIELRLTAGVYQSGVGTFAFDTTRRWAHNPASDGLIVMTTRREGLASEVALRASGRALDYWNSEAEGPLSEEVARLYAGKVMVVADARTVTHDITRESLMRVMRQGAFLLDLRALDVRDRGAGQSLADVLESASSGFPLRSQVGPLSLRQSNPFLLAGGVEQAWAIRTGDASAAIRFASVFSQPYARILDWAATATEVEAASDAALAVRAKVISEMRAVNDADTDHFKKGNPQLAERKVVQYVGAVLASNGSARQRLLALYPDFLAARKKLGGWFDRHRLQLKRILKPVAKIAD
jgi:hypothetical protein